MHGGTGLCDGWPNAWNIKGQNPIKVETRISRYWFKDEKMGNLSIAVQLYNQMQEFRAEICYSPCVTLKVIHHLGAHFPGDPNLHAASLFCL